MGEVSSLPNLEGWKITFPQKTSENYSYFEVFSGSHSRWRKQSVDQLIRWRIATRASILGNCRGLVSFWARAAGLGRFRQRPSLIWAMDPSLRDISDMTPSGLLGSKLRIPQYLDIFQRMNRWTISYRLFPPRFDGNRGTAEAQWGGLGEAGEQGQLLFFLGDTSISVESYD